MANPIPLFILSHKLLSYVFTFSLLHSPTFYLFTIIYFMLSKQFYPHVTNFSLCLPSDLAKCLNGLSIICNNISLLSQSCNQLQLIWEELWLHKQKYTDNIKYSTMFIFVLHYYFCYLPPNQNAFLYWKLIVKWFSLPLLSVLLSNLWYRSLQVV
jgi:hypothetical protein